MYVNVVFGENCTSQRCLKMVLVSGASDLKFQGYLLGNPKTFPADVYYKIPFCHGMGIISDELYEVSYICQSSEKLYMQLNATFTIRMQSLHFSIIVIEEKLWA